ncbi:MAG: lipoate--protein ligase family protein [Candidatus Aminicenantes bacterium]|nr:lipoate--protein ligase family protein [Candidatus Aminicenantes bacterium]
MANWYLVNDKAPLPAAENMARDEYLFQLCHEKKTGFFRLYSWAVPTFSIGVSQQINKVLNLEYIENSDFSYVRRITGGKTVLHYDEITYAVITSADTFYKRTASAPYEGPGGRLSDQDDRRACFFSKGSGSISKVNDLYKSYMLIAKILVSAFQRLGIDAYLSQGSPSKLSKSNNPCFSFPTPNEIEIAGKKIVGSAQKRDNTALLQHGSIPVTMDFAAYARGTGVPEGLIGRSMTTLNQVCEKSRENLAAALIESFESFIGGSLQEFEFGKSHTREITKLREKYASKDWNFSR